MRKIRDYLNMLKMLKETIPVIWNLIESGNNFDTAMELMDHAFTLINTKLAPLQVAKNMKNRITDAEYKS